MCGVVQEGGEEETDDDWLIAPLRSALQQLASSVRECLV